MIDKPTFLSWFENVRGRTRRRRSMVSRRSRCGNGVSIRPRGRPGGGPEGGLDVAGTRAGAIFDCIL